MDKLEFYHNIISVIDGICSTFISAYCCVVWTRPFLDRNIKAWLTGGAYAVTMLLLNFMPWYISPMLAYILGAMAVFFMMYLSDREYAAQKLFIAITFFCLRWQALRIIVYINNEIDGIMMPYLMSSGEMFRFLWSVFTLYIGYDLLSLLFLKGAVKCMLWSYGREREAMSGKEFLLLSIPSLSGAVSYGVIRYYSYIYERDVGKSVYDLYGSHDLIMSLFTVLSFTVILVTAYVFRQWKTQQEEDRQREIFSAQMSDLQSHISEVERLYRDLRSLRHDMENHLMTLEQLYDSGEYEAAEKYAGTLRREI